MSDRKRLLSLGIALVLVLSGLGLGIVRADDETPGANSAIQAERPAWLGVSIADSDDGVVVREVVPGSPADEAGIRVGDVITAVDGTAVDSAQALVDLIASYAPGDEITVTTEWRGVSREHSVTLGERPADLETRRSPEITLRPGVGVHGVFNLFGLTAELTDEGLVIETLEDDSPFAAAGLQEGDVITQINGVDVSASMGHDLMLSFRSGEPLSLTVLRDGEEMTVEVDLGSVMSDLMPSLPKIEKMMPHGRGAVGFGLGSLINALLGIDAELTDDGLAIRAIDEGSPLADSGLQAGDVITAVNDVSLTEIDLGAIMRLLGGLRPGSTLTLSVLRDGEEITLEFDLPANFSFPRVSPRLGTMMMGAQPTQLGVQFAVITPDLAAERDLPVEEGALIERVYDDTPAARAGLQVGDIVTAVEGEPVDQRRTLRERLLPYDEGEVVTLTVLRDGEELSLDVTLGPNPGGVGFGFGPGPEGGALQYYFFGPDELDEHFFNMPHFFFGPGGRFEFGPFRFTPAQPEGEGMPSGPRA